MSTKKKSNISQIKLFINKAQFYTPLLPTNILFLSMTLNNDKIIIFQGGFKIKINVKCVTI